MKQTLLLFFLIFNVCLYGQKHADLSARFDIEKNAIGDLQEAPQEEIAMNKQVRGKTIILHDPQNNPIEFQCFENTTMSEEMKKAFPLLKTYTGYALSDPSKMATITAYDGKIEAYIHQDSEPPIEINFDDINQKYISSYHQSEEEHHCGLDDSHMIRKKSTSDRGLLPQNGSNLKTFDMALVITPLFITNFGGNLAAATTQAMAVMNNINVVYRKTLAITFTVTIRVDNSNIYVVSVDQNGNPIANPTTASTAVKTYFTSSEYDVGHVFQYFANGGSGVAYLGVVCENGLISVTTGPFKAGGVSTAVNTSLLYDIAVHEIGHQFGAGHTLSGTQGSCAGFSFDGSSSVEPGAGISIMSYSNVCGSDNTTSQSGAEISGDNTYFHAKSISQMIDYINTQSCHTTSGVVNNPPVASANPCGVTTFSIPRSTPFELIGSASDADNDNLIYQWDQVDLGSAVAIGGNCGGTTGPIFRSYPPTSSPKRTFPSLEYILNNANSPITRVGECLPSVARSLNFQFIAYDNNVNAGGTSIQNLLVTVANVGPLKVTSPDTNVTYNQGSTQTITWTNNTSSLSDSVNILLSVDGGITWPYTLASTPNDGSHSVTIPSNIPGGTKARIRVESRKYSCFKFFDVSNVNFTITSNCVATSTVISPATPLITTMGNSNLNLAQQNNLGAPLTAAFVGTIASSDNPGNLIFLNGTPAACSGPSNFTYFDVLVFSVNVSGSYTILHGNTDDVLINLYANQFTGPNCSNHVSSSATRPSGSGGVFLNSGLTTTLTANTIYYLMISGFSDVPAIPNYSITFTKPAGATVYKDGLAPAANYSYTYIAVNKTTNIITQQSATSNFTTLPSGIYDIYGLHYYSGSGTTPPNVNPTSWINQNFTTVKNSPTCIAISSNSRQVTIQDCILTVTTQAATGFGSFASIMSPSQSGCKVVFAPGIDTINLSTPLDLTGNMTVDGTGQNILINFSNNTALYALKNTSTALTTLKNIKIKHMNPGSSANLLLNEGMLTLDGVSLIGNVNEVLKNSSPTSHVIVKGTVSIRKN